MLMIRRKLSAGLSARKPVFATHYRIVMLSIVGLVTGTPSGEAVFGAIGDVCSDEVI